MLKMSLFFLLAQCFQLYLIINPFQKSKIILSLLDIFHILNKMISKSSAAYLLYVGKGHLYGDSSRFCPYVFKVICCMRVLRVRVLTIHTSTLVFPGTGTGALRSRRIHVSISRISWNTKLPTLSLPWPVNTPHTESLKTNWIIYN